MKPLGKNQGGYLGEPIDASEVLQRIDSAARSNLWQAESFQLEPDFILRAFCRRQSAPRKTVYISAGIHGDEPSGPLAILHLLEKNTWPLDLNLFLCPLLNPSGFPLNTRQNQGMIDQNRDYRHLRSLEVRTHIEWFSRQSPFDLALCLHEDWEAKGFYLYELNPDDGISLAPAILQAVASICPIDFSEKIDDWDATKGLIRPQIKPEERELWAEATYLIAHKTRQSYTLETPSDFPLPVRVEAHARAVETALRAL